VLIARLLMVVVKAFIASAGKAHPAIAKLQMFLK
jgi:hypothetical protein